MNKKYLYFLAISAVLGIMFMPIFEQCEMIKYPHYTYDENGCATEKGTWWSGDVFELRPKVKGMCLGHAYTS